MTAILHCYNCGQDLSALTLPVSRRDLCPSCSVHVHVCRMCEHFDPAVIRQCREEDAEDVVDKRKVNFCEWFRPSAGAWDGRSNGTRDRAMARAEALFGGSDAEPGSDDPGVSEAEKLFR